MKTFFTLLTGAALLSGCYYDKAEEVYPQLLLNNSCDTAGTISYSTHITVVLQNHCLSCHSTASPSGNVTLDTYAGVQAVAASGQFLGSVEHQAGFSQMPSNNPQLQPCQLTQIRKWVQAGAPNN
jgi:mono/diheme cytochrome c family protein